MADPCGRVSRHRAGSGFGDCHRSSQELANCRPSPGPRTAVPYRRHCEEDHPWRQRGSAPRPA
jgi:hypothetical protein